MEREPDLVIAAAPSSTAAADRPSRPTSWYTERPHRRRRPPRRSGRRGDRRTRLLVTPGFVDVHTHLDAQLTWDPAASLVTRHGDHHRPIVGNCGVGFAPCRPADRDYLMFLMEGVEDIPRSAMAAGMRWEWKASANISTRSDAADSARTSAGTSVTPRCESSPWATAPFHRRGAHRHRVGDDARRRRRGHGRWRPRRSRPVERRCTGRRPAIRCRARSPIAASSRLWSNRSVAAAPASSRWCPTARQAKPPMALPATSTTSSAIAHAAGRPLSVALTQARQYPDGLARFARPHRQRGARWHAHRTAGRATQRRPATVARHPFAASPPARGRRSPGPATRRTAQPSARPRRARPPCRQRRPGRRDHGRTGVARPALPAGRDRGPVLRDARARAASPASRRRPAGRRVRSSSTHWWNPTCGRCSWSRSTTSISTPLLRCCRIRRACPAWAMPARTPARRATSACRPSCSLTGSAPVERWRWRPPCGSSRSSRRASGASESAVWCNAGWYADLNVVDLGALDLGPVEIRHELPGGAVNLYQSARGYRATVVNGSVVMRDGVPTGAHPGRVLRSTNGGA